jgi:hypothetical protein
MALLPFVKIPGETSPENVAGIASKPLLSQGNRKGLPLPSAVIPTYLLGYIVPYHPWLRNFLLQRNRGIVKANFTMPLFLDAGFVIIAHTASASI